MKIRYMEEIFSKAINYQKQKALSYKVKFCIFNPIILLGFNCSFNNANNYTKIPFKFFSIAS